MLEPQLDVRAMRKPDKHPRIFERFDALEIGESFVLINNHDPKHLREEFETDHAGEFGLDYLQRGPERWEIRISRLASTPLHRLLCDTREIATGQFGPDASGAVWKLQPSRRHLDANIIHLQPGSRIQAQCRPRPRCPVAHPARPRPADNRGRHTDATSGAAGVAASLVQAGNRGRRGGVDLPHRSLTSARNNHPAGAAADLVALIRLFGPVVTLFRVWAFALGRSAGKVGLWPRQRRCRYAGYTTNPKTTTVSGS
jgi:uncharacterized protein (DUF2249 family)